MRARVPNFSISLDGFGTGEGRTPEAPFGHAGERLHEWMFAAEMDPVDAEFNARQAPGFGAEIMGRGKFGPEGPWPDDTWRGWWGDNPPFHTPVFVLTHHPREPIEMEGGTTFHFIDATPQEALAQAVAAAGGKDVRIGGGVSMLRDFLAAGLIDELHVAIVPIVLGRGMRLWDGLEELQKGYAVESVTTGSGVTHVTFTR